MLFDLQLCTRILMRLNGGVVRGDASRDNQLEFSSFCAKKAKFFLHPSCNCGKSLRPSRVIRLFRANIAPPIITYLASFPISATDTCKSAHGPARMRMCKVAEHVG
jgi:hypothetical protein